MSTKNLVICAALILSIATLNAQKKERLLRIGDRPPALECRTLISHEALNWANLKNRVVVIEFWATWCPPCIKNIPHINELVKAFRDKPVTFVSVTYENESMVKKFVAQHPIETIVGLDNDFAMFRSYKAWGLPMTVIVNKRGRIASVLHPDHLSDSVVNDVLAGKTPHVEPAKAWSDPTGAEKYFRSLVVAADSSALK